MPLTRAEAEQVVYAATLAPSVLKVQPWRFEVRGAAIELHRDPARVLRAVDPMNRALTISCGAALYNLRIAITGLGWRPAIELLPDGPRSTLLARVVAAERVAPTPTQLWLLAAIPVRRTSRVPFTDEPPPVALVRQLEDAAAAESVTFRLLDRDMSWDLAQVVHEADLVQRAATELRAEVLRCTRRDTTTADGIPQSALGPIPRDPAALVRDFAMGEPVPHRQVANFETRSHLGILLTRNDDQESWLQAGQALESVWLEIADAGWGLSLLTQPLEVSILRWLMRQLTASVAGDPGDGASPHMADRPSWPQVLLGLFIAARSTALSFISHNYQSWTPGTLTYRAPTNPVDHLPTAT